MEDRSGATAGEWAREALVRRLTRFDHWRREIGHALAPESVHQVRVSVRRLRAALETFGPLLDLPRRTRVGPLRRVERRLGELRDLHIIEAALGSDHPPDLDHEGHAALLRVRAFLGERGSAAVDRARTAIGRRGLRRLRERLGTWLDASRFRPQAALPPAAIFPDLILPTLSRVLAHPGWLSPAPLDFSDPDGRALHALRRRLKELRYRTECLEGWYGAPVSGWIENLHRLQDILGAWHDEALVLECLTRAGGPRALAESARERAGEARRAWAEASAKYLDTGYRSSLRRMLGDGASAIDLPSGVPQEGAAPAEGQPGRQEAEMETRQSVSPPSS